MVAAPSSRVSSRPRRFRMRSVKTWPRSRSAAIWISSTARNDDVEIPGHRLHGGDPEPRIFRLDLLLAGDQRDRFRPRAIGDLVVDLARQKPQRQADDPRGMRQHPLDRQMGLAGIGRPEHGGDAGAGSPCVGKRGRRRRKGHVCWRFLCCAGALSSLRAGGSHERAPDDKTPRSNPSGNRGSMDCFRLRSLSYGGRVVAWLLAMTKQILISLCLGTVCAVLLQFATAMWSRLKVWNGYGTNRAQSVTPLHSGFVHRNISDRWCMGALDQVCQGPTSPRFGGEFLKFRSGRSRIRSGQEFKQGFGRFVVPRPNPRRPRERGDDVWIKLAEPHPIPPINSSSPRAALSRSLSPLAGASERSSSLIGRDDGSAINSSPPPRCSASPLPASGARCLKQQRVNQFVFATHGAFRHSGMVRKHQTQSPQLQSGSMLCIAPE